MTVEKGKGRVTWLPWDAGALYYRHSLTGHRLLLRGIVGELLEGSRQSTTSAHPLVEMTWMKQGERRLLHMINMYFTPVPMRGIAVSVKGSYSKRAV